MNVVLVLNILMFVHRIQLINIIQIQQLQKLRQKRIISSNYCNQILVKIQGASKLQLTEQQWAKIYFQLKKNGIKKLSQVNESIIENILYYLINVDKDKFFEKYVSQVWAIVSHIRQKQVLKFSDESLAELKLVIQRIEEDINKYQMENVFKNSEEGLTATIVAQLAFWVLNYPMELVIYLFKPTVSNNALDKFQKICDFLIKKNKWDDSLNKNNNIFKNNHSIWYVLMQGDKVSMNLLMKVKILNFGKVLKLKIN